MTVLRKAMVLAAALLVVCCGPEPATRSPTEQAAPSLVPTANQASSLPQPTDTTSLVVTSPTVPTAGTATRPLTTLSPRQQEPKSTLSPTAASTDAVGPEATRPPATVAVQPDQARLVLVYDNTASRPNLEAEWGFAAWIEYGEHTVLFDTGPTGAALLGNLAQLGLDPGDIDAIVISHSHSDHTGGLLALLQTGVQPTVYVPTAFPDSFRRLVSQRTELVQVREPVEILPGLHSTGELRAGVAEQALVLETSAGAVVVTGCAHPGIVPIISRARSLVPGDIALVLGGFHLLETPAGQLDRIIATFRDYGVKQVAPTHCTGETAIQRFASEYGDDALEGGAGRVFVVGHGPATSDGSEATALSPQTKAATPRADGLSADEAATLDSLEQVDDYPLYTMRYYGHYPDPVASADREGQVAWAFPWSCSLFAAMGDPASRLYGRNFDWDYSPALLLFTDPPDGYASVSMVAAASLVGMDRAVELMDLPLKDRRQLLTAPLRPYDGLNELGLAIGMAAVPPGGVQPDPAKRTVGSLGVIRQILDHARDVDEATTILQRYNVSMEGGPTIHYLVADREGRSVLVEFYQGSVVVMPNQEAWDRATNFLRAGVGMGAEAGCWRYDLLDGALSRSRGRLAPAQALDLLSQVSQQGTQWSVIYGMSTGQILISMGGQYDQPHGFSLSLVAGP